MCSVEIPSPGGRGGAADASWFEPLGTLLQFLKPLQCAFDVWAFGIVTEHLNIADEGLISDIDITVTAAFTGDSDTPNPCDFIGMTLSPPVGTTVKLFQQPQVPRRYVEPEISNHRFP